MNTNPRVEIIHRLSSLTNIENKLESQLSALQDNLLNLIPPALHDRYLEIVEEHELNIETLEADKNEIKEQIREIALTSKLSVNGDNFRVRYYKGKISWDTKKLQKYMVNKPEVKAFMKTGNPWTSISKIS